MNPREVLEYYSREDVQKAIIEIGRDREVVGVFRKGGFGERPNVVLYPKDISSMVRNGVVEFHCSLERWTNPMSIRHDNHESLRSGWDIILDIDGKGWEHSKLAAKLLCDALKGHGINSFFIKYTGGKGFHLGIPWESIPKRVEFKQTVRLYPDLARKIGLYLKEQIRESLSSGLIKLNTPEEIAEISGKPLGKILVENDIDPFQAVDIDPILISPRHLFRMPYSLNAKSFLVSMPIKPEGVLGFEKEMARPSKVRAKPDFLIGGEEGEAGSLVAETLDWANKQKKATVKRMERNPLKDAVAPGMFPPCIKCMAGGLPDGRKRSMFIMLNFLKCMKWKNDEIERFVTAANEKNKPPLPESYMRGQVRWHKMRNKEFPPPNCAQDGWYEQLGVCQPDETCGFQKKSVKNPTAYPLILMDGRKDKKSKTNKPSKAAKPRQYTKGS